MYYKEKGTVEEIPVKSVPKPKRMEEKTVFFSRMEGESSYPQTAAEGPSGFPL